MTAYYNDINLDCCQWLENLHREGIIPSGITTARDIQEITGAGLEYYTQCHFFAGVGGWPLALRLAGWPDDWPVWTGSCPCQPFSCAGKRKGDADKRHLWPTFRRLIDKCRPPIIFGEQVASKDGRLWLAGVRADLEAMGYAVGAADLCAAGVGAPHIRQRLFWVAYAGSLGFEPRSGRPDWQSQERLHWEEFGADGKSNGLGDTGQPRLERHAGHGDGRQEPGWLDAQAHGHAAKTSPWDRYAVVACTDGNSRRFEPESFPLVAGIPAKARPVISRLVELGFSAKDAARIVREARRNRIVQLQGYGNAIVPALAAEFILAVMEVVAYEATGL